MRLSLLLIFMTVTALCFGQSVKRYTALPGKVEITLDKGTLRVSPLSECVIRVQYGDVTPVNIPEIILTEKKATPKFQVTESSTAINISTSRIKVVVDKKSGALSYADASGKFFLNEKPGGRTLTPSSVSGEPCFIAEQTFDSPDNEFLFGLGQFQDGHYNLKNVSRKLTQVNSQIAIPFLYSSRGFGILWHQYGLTEFNPADNQIVLTKKVKTDENQEVVSVTSESGAKIVSRRQALYTGKFSVAKTGEYVVQLDLQNMENRHMLIIDDSTIVDQENLWLPPAVSALVKLKSGEHTVSVICNASNTPKLTYRQTDNTTTLRSSFAKSFDYVLFHGKNADEIIDNYRELSGQVPMLPLWAYGFWQCRERYNTSKELIETVKEFRQRKLPMDVIVQDWQYWSKDSWGVPKLDESRYPDPSGFIKELHNLHSRFAISIWSNPDKNSAIGKSFVERGLYIPDTKWLDYFNPETQVSYWNTLNENLFSHGTDAWWMDATEPENDALPGTKTYEGTGDFYRLTYPLFVCKSVYEGQRKTSSEKRVTVLTRSAFAGQQRYGTVNWSGDIAGTWDGFKRQLVGGLNYSMTGMPFWTTDIGGFFRPGPSQYTDKKYHDLLTRWFQWGAFCTVFRIHGYQTETEPWKYGAEVVENIHAMLDLRYRLIPYIYSEAWQITHNGSTLMRPMVMDFQEDQKAITQRHQYMFGPSMLVSPVLVESARNWNVYLPIQQGGWFDFWSGKKYDGGQTVTAEAPLNQIPLFVRAGAILPMGKLMQYTAEKPADTLEIRVYTGAAGTFTLYEDEGDNYNYEKGSHATITFHWDEKNKRLTIDKRQGSYNGMLKERVFNIVWVSESSGAGAGVSPPTQEIKYRGDAIVVVKK